MQFEHFSAILAKNIQADLFKEQAETKDKLGKNFLSIKTV